MRFSSKFWAQCATIIAGFTAMEAKAGNSTVNVDTDKLLTVDQKISGSGTLVKTGAGTLLITKDNATTDDAFPLAAAFTGPTNVTAGTLELGNANALGGQGGGLLTMAGNTRLFTAAESMILPNAIQLNASASDGSKIVQFDTNGNTFTLTGLLSEFQSAAAILEVDGSGTLVLNGGNANTYTGGTTLAGTSTLQIANASAIPSTGTITLGAGTTLQDAASATLGNAITLNGAATIDTMSSQTLTTSGAISGTATLTKKNTGILVLSGSNSGNTTTKLTITGGTVSVAADTNIPGGTLTLNGGILLASTGYASSKALTMAADSSIGAASGETLAYTGTITDADSAKILHVNSGTMSLGSDYSSNTMTNLQVDTGSILSIGAANNLTGGTLTLNGGTLHTSADIGTLGKAIALTDNSTLDVLSGTSLTEDQAIGGAHTLTKTSVGTLVLSGTSNSGNATTNLTITGGTVSISAATHLPGGVLTLNGGTLLSMAGSALTGDSKLAPASVSISLASTIDVGTQNAQIDSAIAFTNALTKLGSGTLVLGGSNTDSGGATVSAGALQLTSNNGAGSGTISLASETILEGNISDGNFANPITMTGNATLLATESFTASGAIAEDGASRNLTIGGAHTVTLNPGAANTYTGTTTLANTATLSISAANQLSPAALIMGKGTALHVTGAMTLPCGISL